MPSETNPAANPAPTPTSSIPQQQQQQQQAPGRTPWQALMSKDDRIKVCYHVMGKLESFFRSSNKAVTKDELKNRTRIFESAVYTKSLTREEYLQKIAEGLTGIEKKTSENNRIMMSRGGGGGGAGGGGMDVRQAQLLRQRRMNASGVVQGPSRADLQAQMAAVARMRMEQQHQQRQQQFMNAQGMVGGPGAQQQQGGGSMDSDVIMAGKRQAAVAAAAANINAGLKGAAVSNGIMTGFGGKSQALSAHNIGGAGMSQAMNVNTNVGGGGGVSPEQLLRLQEQIQRASAAGSAGVSGGVQQLEQLYKNFTPQQIQLLSNLLTGRQPQNNTPMPDQTSFQTPTPTPSSFGSPAQNHRISQQQQQPSQEQLRLLRHQQLMMQQQRQRELAHVRQQQQQQQRQNAMHGMGNGPNPMVPGSSGVPMNVFASQAGVSLPPKVPQNEEVYQTGMMNGGGGSESSAVGGRIPGFGNVNVNQAQLIALEQAKAAGRQQQRQSGIKAHLNMIPNGVGGGPTGNVGGGIGSAGSQGQQPQSQQQQGQQQMTPTEAARLAAVDLQLENVIGTALGAGIAREDIFGFIRGHQSKLIKAGVLDRVEQLRVIASNLYKQTQEIFRHQRETKNRLAREDAFFTKLEEMRAKYKEVLTKLRPMIDKLQERKDIGPRREFQKRLSDCFSLLEMKRAKDRTVPLKGNMDPAILQKVEKFMVMVIVAYSKHMRNMISRTGPHSGTKSVLLSRFEAQIGKIAREMEGESWSRQQECDPIQRNRGAGSSSVSGVGGVKGLDPTMAMAAKNIGDVGGVGVQGLANLTKVELATLVANNPQLAQNPIVQQMQQRHLQNAGIRLDGRQQNGPISVNNRVDPQQAVLLQNQIAQGNLMRASANVHTSGQSRNALAKSTAAFLIPQRVAQLEIDVKTAVEEAAMLEKYVDAEVKHAKNERIRNTLEALKSNDRNTVDDEALREGRGVKRANPDDVTEVDNTSLDAGGLIETKNIFECSGDQGVRWAKRIKTERSDVGFLGSAVEAECRAAVKKNPILVLSIEEEFGYPIVNAMLNIEAIKLPKIVISVERGYPRKGGAAYGFERPPLGFTGILGDVREKFRRNLQHLPSSGYTVAGILNAWARAADTVCNGSQMAKGQKELMFGE